MGAVPPETTPDATPLEVDDAIVLLLGAPSGSASAQGHIDGITRLEKLVFLLERETPIGELLSEDAEFRPYNYGPFSSKVYKAIDTLVLAGLVQDSTKLAPSSDDAWETAEVIGVESADAYTTRTVSLTDRGEQYYKALLKELPRGTEKDVADFKERFATIPLRQLVRYVYKRYPTMTERSIIVDDILGR